MYRPFQERVVDKFPVTRETLLMLDNLGNGGNNQSLLQTGKASRTQATAAYLPR